jgi:hypothetical protein
MKDSIILFIDFENPTRYAVILNKTVLNTLLQFEPKLKDAHSSNKKITLFSVFGLQEVMLFKSSFLNFFYMKT